MTVTDGRRGILFKLVRTRQRAFCCVAVTFLLLEVSLFARFNDARGVDKQLVAERAGEPPSRPVSLASCTFLYEHAGCPLNDSFVSSWRAALGSVTQARVERLHVELRVVAAEPELAADTGGIVQRMHQLGMSESSCQLISFVSSCVRPNSGAAALHCASSRALADDVVVAPLLLDAQDRIADAGYYSGLDYELGMLVLMPHRSVGEPGTSIREAAAKRNATATAAAAKTFHSRGSQSLLLLLGHHFLVMRRSLFVIRGGFARTLGEEATLDAAGPDARRMQGSARAFGEQLSGVFVRRLCAMFQEAKQISEYIQEIRALTRDESVMALHRTLGELGRMGTVAVSIGCDGLAKHLKASPLPLSKELRMEVSRMLGIRSKAGSAVNEFLELLEGGPGRRAAAATTHRRTTGEVGRFDKTIGQLSSYLVNSVQPLAVELRSSLVLARQSLAERRVFFRFLSVETGVIPHLALASHCVAKLRLGNGDGRLHLAGSWTQTRVTEGRLVHAPAGVHASSALYTALPPSLRALRTLVASDRLRVMWASDCCRCCGFSSEIEHLAPPLERYLPVMTNLGSDCFCNSTLHQQLTLQRMQVSQSGFFGESSVGALPSSTTPSASHKKTVWISHTDPSLYRALLYAPSTRPESSQWQPAYFIGRSMFEFSRTRPSWPTIVNSNFVNEVWVPSNFVKQAFVESGVAPGKVFVIPEAIDCEVWAPAPAASNQSSSEDDATFDRLLGGQVKILDDQLQIFNTHPKLPISGRPVFLSHGKLEPRKGFDTLLESFIAAFSGVDPQGSSQDPAPTLIILTQHWFTSQTSATPFNISLVMTDFLSSEAGIITDAGGLAAVMLRDFFVDGKPKRHGSSTVLWPHIVIVARQFSERELVELYRAATVFVLPTRGEGWGLPIMQAMASGTPVLVTNYSGHLDFASHRNAFLIPVRNLVVVSSRTSMYDVDQETLWAEPDEAALTAMMKWIVGTSEGHTQRAAKASRARANIVASFSEEAVVSQMLKRLEIVARWISS